MIMRAAAIGIQFKDPRVDDLPFRSAQTWIDRELLLLRMDEVDGEYYSMGTYKGAQQYSEDESARLLADFERRRNELGELLALGRTMIVFLPPPRSWWLDTGQREYSGTGRNRQTTRLLSPMKLYSLLPFALQAEAASTRDLELVGAEPFASFWRAMKGKFAAAARLTAEFGTPTLTIAGARDAVVASIARMKGGGIVIVLPQDLLYYDPDARVTADDGTNSASESVEKTRDYDSKRDDEDEDEDEDEDGALVEDVEFLDAVFELVRALRADAGDFHQPAGAEAFTQARERDATWDVATAEEQASAALATLDEAKARVAELTRRKVLIHGTGKAFEIVAEEAFEALGFTVREGNPGRTDRILHYESRAPAVAEAKGKAKSAAEADSAQLEKWVTEYLLAEGVQPKGVLVVNAWRDVPLDRRTQEAFPGQMLPYAEARSHCLMTGAQLLGAWLDVEENPIRREAVIDAIYNTIGRFNLYTDWPNFLQRAAQSVPAEADRRSD